MHAEPAPKGLPPTPGFDDRDAVLRSLVEHASIGVAFAGRDERLAYANRPFGEMFGYRADECVGLGLDALIHPAERRAAREQLDGLLHGVIESLHVERSLCRKDGTAFWGRISVSAVRDNRTGAIFNLVLQVEDIDQRKAAEAALAESERRWNFALEGAGQGVWDHDLRNGTVFYSRMWRQMRGIGPDEAVDGSKGAWLARVHPDDRDRILEEARKQDTGELPRNAFEYRERHRDGRWIWILSRGRPVEWNPDGTVARIIGTDTDISSLKEAEALAAEEKAETYRRHLAALEKAHKAAEDAQQLAQSLARHDALTGLPNRRIFAEALDAAIARAERKAGVSAVMIVDLDRFKPVNDIHGHLAGDTVLREIAKRLGGLVRRSDTLARLGGDEFGVILECSTDEPPGKAAGKLAQRIIDSVQAPVEIGEGSVNVGATVGVALCPHDGKDSQTLLSAADMAMYRAKEGGRGAFQFFQRSMETELRAKAELEDDVRRAVAHDEIEPHFQPLMHLKEGRLVGFEVLARWRHPTRGAVEPDVFIPVVERLGLMAEFTYSLLRRACRAARDWPADITIALNVSPTHFSDPVMPVKLLAILSETGFPPNRLEIEVTESALVSDLPTARAVLVALQDIGIKISLDDFGTGYSSLYHLRELHFDKIKIDRSFVLSMESNVESAKIVRSVINLAKSLGLPTIAEGIEHSQTLKQIVSDGADYGQGFYFAEAMSADAADRLVHEATASEIRQRA
jgi:diguanylate cyclase (GGDEF)-like protein/PAS domain S-box-containing protein